MKLGSTKQRAYQNVIDGLYGEFKTQAGTVCYLQTKAKVGRDGSSYSKLTSSLVPAREALNISEMDFNQLLQRDLDDHRIITKLIPYILTPPENSLPGFFPPIVAVILPFNHLLEPEDSFPEVTEKVEKDPTYGDGNFRITEYGESFRSQILLSGSTDEPDELALGVIRWDPERAKMVIMDGQHRAMALLAIQRTIEKSWDASSRGAKYQSFYKKHIENLLEKITGGKEKLDLGHIELPVTICWFPEKKDKTIKRSNPHKSARKLFVDVNNTAKPPSASRLVLLSDTQLDNILARELLNRVRVDEQWNRSFPLYSIEYDNPEEKSTRPKRWSVVTNLDILKDAVVRTVFGPPKYIESASYKLANPPKAVMDAYMRKMLNVRDYISEEYEDGDRRCKRDKIGNEEFPINDIKNHKKLLDVFFSQWGQGILHILSNIDPYKKHIQALKDRYDSWLAGDNRQTLAKEALFEGIGMLWTLENGHQLWLDECKIAREERRDLPQRPDVSEAWSILEEDQKPKFRERRAELYLGSKTENDIKKTDKIFDGLITYAAQIGAILAWASLRSTAASSAEPLVIAKALTSAINTSFGNSPVSTHPLREIFYRDGDNALIKIQKLEPAFAVHYRYVWLEIALLENNEQILQEAGINLVEARKFLSSARKSYINMLVSDRAKALKNDTSIRMLETSKQDQAAKSKALDQIKEEQAQAHKYWFARNIDDARNLIKHTLEGAIDESDEPEIASSELDETTSDPS